MKETLKVQTDSEGTSMLLYNKSRSVFAILPKEFMDETLAILNISRVLGKCYITGEILPDGKLEIENILPDQRW